MPWTVSTSLHPAAASRLEVQHSLPAGVSVWCTHAECFVQVCALKTDWYGISPPLQQYALGWKSTGLLNGG
jgi:hypothetical protein